MNDDVKPDLELDLRGQLCPMPIIKLSQNIHSVPVGGVVHVVATDPASVPDVVAWAKSTGHEVLRAEKLDGEFDFLVRRTK